MHSYKSSFNLYLTNDAKFIQILYVVNFGTHLPLVVSYAFIFTYDFIFLPFQPIYRPLYPPFPLFSPLCVAILLITVYRII